VSPSKKVNKPKSAREKKGQRRRALPLKKGDKTADRSAATKQRQNWLTLTLRILALLAVIGITVYISGIRDRVKEFEAYGYPGIFLIALLANATVFLPAPGVAVVFAMGSVFNPLGVALAAGTGGALGEISGYLAGFSGQAVVENSEAYNRILPWVQRYGVWAILTLAAIPNPLFDLAGIAAGVAKIPLWKFLLFCWVGQAVKMAIFAYAGAFSIDWLAAYI
jgi:uncharacterized membrane protein YdjX (TVP38/TMEM64 family)